MLEISCLHSSPAIPSIIRKANEKHEEWVWYLFNDFKQILKATHAWKFWKSLLNGLDSFASEAVCIIAGMIIPSLWLILGCLVDGQQPFYVSSHKCSLLCVKGKQIKRRTESRRQKRRRIKSQWWSQWNVDNNRKKHFRVIWKPFL